MVLESGGSVEKVEREGRGVRKERWVLGMREREGEVEVGRD